MKVIHCLFLSLPTFGTFTPETATRWDGRREADLSFPIHFVRAQHP